MNAVGATQIPTQPDFGAFWRWWATAHRRIEHAIATRQWEPLVEEVSAHVLALHPGLAWEFQAGRHAKHALCITANGAPELRRLTERWARSAPAPSASG